MTKTPPLASAKGGVGLYKLFFLSRKILGQLVKLTCKTVLKLSESRSGICHRSSKEVGCVTKGSALNKYEIAVSALLDEVDHFACFIVTGILELERNFIEFGSNCAK